MDVEGEEEYYQTSINALKNFTSFYVVYIELFHKNRIESTLYIKIFETFCPKGNE